MAVKINKLEIENTKRVKAVAMEPAESGLTVIGGDNNQGKTSVLDSITWALGGNKFKPSEAHREGSVVNPYIRVELSNGLVVERKGKNSSLKVIDPSGNLAGQQLLDEFISVLALDLPKFMQASDKEKADTLLKIIGVGDKLYELDKKIQEVYNQRRTIGQIADQKQKYAEELPVYPDAPSEPVSALEMIQKQQEILAKNGENQRKRALAERYDRELAEAQIAYDRAKTRLQEAQENAITARTSAKDLQDESTAELEHSIQHIEEINDKVKVNQTKALAQKEAADYKDQYEECTEEITSLRNERIALLDGADLPLPELSIEDGALTYKGQKWDNMSGSDQLRVAVAIVRKINPGCGFVLIDKLEQMDLTTLKEFGAWLEKEGLQAIATRVSKGDECSIIIEDGYSHQPSVPVATTPAPKFKAGEF